MKQCFGLLYPILYDSIFLTTLTCILNTFYLQCELQVSAGIDKGIHKLRRVG